MLWPEPIAAYAFEIVIYVSGVLVTTFFILRDHKMRPMWWQEKFGSSTCNYISLFIFAWPIPFFYVLYGAILTMRPAGVSSCCKEGEGNEEEEEEDGPITLYDAQLDPDAVHLSYDYFSKLPTDDTKLRELLTEIAKRSFYEGYIRGFGFGSMSYLESAWKDSKIKKELEGEEIHGQNLKDTDSYRQGGCQ